MIATAFLILLAAYLACGLVFAVPFALVGVKKIDPHAAHGSWGFQLLVIPGTMAFWPLLLRRWVAGVKEPPEECNTSSCGTKRSPALIRPLRQRHRRMVTMLGVILPIAFAVGVVARKSVPDMISLPPGLGATPVKFTVTEWERTDLFTKTPIQVRLVRESAGMGRFALEFSAGKDFVKPDLIVYWIAGSPNITDTLPDNARLLGAFSSSLPLPQDGTSGNGALVLYSLADHEVVEVSKPFTLQKP